MSRRLEYSNDLRTFLSESASYILILVGMALTLLGLLAFSMNTSMLTIAALCLGISLILTGFLKKIGLLTFDSGFREKTGSLLVLISAFLVAGAAVSLMKIDIVRMWVPRIGAANPQHHNFHFQEANPLSYLFIPLLSIGLLYGLLGLISKKFA